MSKVTPEKKRLNDCYGVINRKRGWKKLSEMMRKKIVMNKITNNNNWEDLDVEYKKQFLANILSEYCGYMRSIGMDKSQVIRTKSYILLKGLCHAREKVLKKDSFRHQWNSLMFCALKHE
jgi:hypothetical protein